jgi:hypothetical protein
VNGCLKGIFRLAIVVVVLIAAAAAWWYRDPLMHTAERWVGRRSTRLPPVADTAVGAPTPGALRAAQSKVASLGQAGGPDSVILNANEMASLIGSGIDWTVRKTFDSLRVELLEGRFAVNARLQTGRIPAEVLGPLRGMLAAEEPLRIAGTLAIQRPGTARWTIEEITLRGFPFPPPAVKTIAQRVAGADPRGAVALTVDRGVLRVTIHPTGVICYRRAAP